MQAIAMKGLPRLLRVCASEDAVCCRLNTELLSKRVKLGTRLVVKYCPDECCLLQSHTELLSKYLGFGTRLVANDCPDECFPPLSFGGERLYMHKAMQGRPR
jgi:hypothetical protein